MPFAPTRNNRVAPRKRTLTSPIPTVKDGAVRRRRPATPTSRIKRSVSPITGEEERVNPNGRYSPRSGVAGWQGDGTRADHEMRIARVTQHYKRQNPKSYLDQETGDPIRVKNVGGKQMRFAENRSNVSRGASVGRQNVGARKGNASAAPRLREKVSNPNPSRKVMYNASVMDQYSAWKKQPSTKKGKKAKTNGPVGRTR